MRVFLSHSSSNKDFVKEVFQNLGSALAEYDDRTFSAGAFSTEAIREALQRCEIFALFATPDSLASGFVEYETKLATEYLAAKKIRRIVTFCLGGVSPQQLPSSIQAISAVRRSVSPGGAARLLRAEIIEAEIAGSTTLRPYVGREGISREIKQRLALADEPTPVAIAFSGVDGVGRRTLAAKVLRDVYPGTGAVSPTVSVPANFTTSDLFRALVDLRGGLSLEQLFERVEKFDTSSDSERIETVVGLLLEFRDQNEIVTLVDAGGLLDAAGALNDQMKEVVAALAQSPRVAPYLVFILFRTPPVPVREKTGVLYFRVDPLDAEDVRQLVSLHIKGKGETASASSLAAIVEMIDGHPYNLQFLLRLLDSSPLDVLVRDPQDLLAFKRRQGDDFVARIDLQPDHMQVLSVLRTLGQSSIEVISTAVDLVPTKLGQSLRQLEEFHCVERIGNIFSINRPLKAAFDRSSTLRLSQSQIEKIQTKVIELFSSYKGDDEVAVDVISAAARAAVFLNKDDEALRAFLLPSSSLFVARQLYDMRRYADCARVASIVIRSNKLVSEQAFVEACRLRCLSLARMGEEKAYNECLAQLASVTSPHSREVQFFLEGFRLRLNGQPEEAIVQFKKSHELNRTSFSVLRELSHSLMMIGEIAEAKKFAVEALKIASTNPYLIDQVLAITIAEYGKVTADIVFDPYVSELLQRLERYGDEEGKSFYAIRMADIYRRAGKLGDALDFAKRASALTPNLLPAHSAEADIYIRQGKLVQADQKIEAIKRMLEDGTTGEGKTRLPEYVLLRAEYLMASGEVSDAVNILRANAKRLGSRVRDMKRRITFQVDKQGLQLSSEDRTWLRSS